MTRTLSVCHLGATPYAEGVRIQEALVERRAVGETGDWLLFPDHPPVLTLGRGTTAGSVIASAAELERLGVEVHEVARGGDVTWHGPGQVVGYTVMDLTARNRDLHRFLRDLEEALIESLATWGLAGERVPERTGVWTDGAKIASIGVAVRRWVSYYGFALNAAPRLEFFDLIHPCGLHGIQMTSLRARLGERAPGLPEVRARVAAAIARRFDYAGFETVDRAALQRVVDAGRAVA